MNKRAAAWLAWSIWAVSFLLLIGGGPLLTAPNAPARSADNTLPSGADLVLLFALLCLLTVGALVASRQSANPIGWIFSISGLALSLGGFAQQYATIALSATPNPLPGGEIMVWIDNWATGPTLYGVFTFLFLLFPNGRLLTHRWRPVAWLAIGTTILLLLVDMFSPGHFTRDFTQVENPLGIAALPGLRNLAGLPLFLLQLLLLLVSAISLVLRFHRSRGDERQQLKWFASAGALLALVFASGPILWSMPGFGNTIWPILFAVALAVIPVATGVAILKYRLYDIDIIINRTLVYGALTGSLAVLYFGSVVSLEALMRPITGQGHNDLVIVISTLIIAALFLPLRARIQSFIDRRFYRRKYDAAKTLASFSATLRDEVDLDRLTGRLVEVVDETMRPEQVSLWLLRPEKERRNGRSGLSPSS